MKLLNNTGLIQYFCGFQEVYEVLATSYKVTVSSIAGILIDSDPCVDVCDSNGQQYAEGSSDYGPDGTAGNIFSYSDHALVVLPALSQTEVVFAVAHVLSSPFLAFLLLSKFSSYIAISCYNRVFLPNEPLHFSFASV